MKLFTFLISLIFLCGMQTVSKTRNIFSRKTSDFKQFRFSQKSSKSLIRQAYEDEDVEQFTSSNAEYKIIKEGWLKISSIHLISTHSYPDIPLEKNNFARVKMIRKNMDPNESSNLYSSGQPCRANSHFPKVRAIPAVDFFWFRISGRYLYYTETNEDMVVLGAISVKNIYGTQNSSIGIDCFTVSNSEKAKWNLCASTQTEKTEWICALSKALGRPCENKTFTNPLIISETRIVKEPILLIPLPSPFCNEGWNYKVHGGDWNCKCSEGFAQSPVNVKKKCVEDLNVSTSFSFFKVKTDRVVSFYEDNMLIYRCKDNKNNNRFEFCEDVVFARIIDIDYTEYSCHEIRFHTPGEHTIENRVFPLEIQIICHPTTEGDYKKKAAIAFLVNEVAGKTNSFFSFIDFLDLPNELKEKSELEKNNGPKEIDVEQLFKDVDDIYEYNGYFNYWRYEGSLTYPPCDEHVRWFIIEKPVKIGHAALEMMKDTLLTVNGENCIGGVKGKSTLSTELLMSGNNPDGNNRMIQPLRERTIYYFDMAASTCVPPLKKHIVSEEGHYEKVTRMANSYIYVPDEKPSGLPNSFVVPKWEAFGTLSPEEERETEIQNIFNRRE